MQRGWTKDIGKLAQKMCEMPNELQRKVAFKMYDAIVLRTPIDTGRARGNWNINTGSADPTVDEERKTAMPLVQSENEIDLPKGDEDIYITNNLPYIVALEYGHSTQSPEGMVGVTLANTQAYISGAIKELKNEYL